MASWAKRLTWLTSGTVLGTCSYNKVMGRGLKIEHFVLLTVCGTFVFLLFLLGLVNLEIAHERANISQWYQQEVWQMKKSLRRILVDRKSVV